jgi:hypothetical protein
VYYQYYQGVANCKLHTCSGIHSLHIGQILLFPSS